MWNMTFEKSLRMFSRKPKKTKVKLSDSYDASLTPDVVAPVAISRPARRADTSHLGIQGYAPRVAVSNNRNRCEGCKELVKPNVRHICLYNAHHHLDTLTEEERDRVIEQLTAERKKYHWI